MLTSLFQQDDAGRHRAETVGVVAADELEDRVVPNHEPNPQHEEDNNVQRMDRVADDALEQRSFEELVEAILGGEVRNLFRLVSSSFVSTVVSWFTVPPQSDPYLGTQTLAPVGNGRDGKDILGWKGAPRPSVCVPR
jgi:hypothetical protein